MDRKDKATNSSNHVALTAHVLIALHNAASRLTGNWWIFNKGIEFLPQTQIF